MKELQAALGIYALLSLFFLFSGRILAAAAEPAWEYVVNLSFDKVVTLSLATAISLSAFQVKNIVRHKTWYAYLPGFKEPQKPEGTNSVIERVRSILRLKWMKHPLPNNRNLLDYVKDQLQNEELLKPTERWR